MLAASEKTVREILGLISEKMDAAGGPRVALENGDAAGIANHKIEANLARELVLCDELRDEFFDCRNLGGFEENPGAAPEPMKVAFQISGMEMGACVGVDLLLDASMPRSPTRGLCCTTRNCTLPL